MKKQEILTEMIKKWEMTVKYKEKTKKQLQLTFGELQGNK